MSTTSEAAGTSPAAPAQKTRGRLASFFCDDHRYVFLGTSVFALIGLALGNSAHPASSFLAASYAVSPYCTTCCSPGSWCLPSRW